MSKLRASFYVFLLLLSSLSYIGECLCILGTPWRFNTQGQWKQGPLSRLSTALMSKALRGLLTPQ